MWPVNGRYSDVQRELYGFVVAYHKMFLDLIRPGVTAEQITAEAAKRMRGVVEAYALAGSATSLRQGARDALKWPYHMTHPVGMAVHDVGHIAVSRSSRELCSRWIPRCVCPRSSCTSGRRDTLLITEDGFENFTAAAPLELDDVERTIAQAECCRVSPLCGDRGETSNLAGAADPGAQHRAEPGL